MLIFVLTYMVLNTQLPSYTVIKERIFMNYSMRGKKGKKIKQLIGYLLVIRCVDPTVVCKNQEHHFLSRLDDLTLLWWR